MVNSPAHAPALDSTFAALADPTRRAILARLALGEATVGELAQPFAVSLPAISKHLRVLETAGLMAREKDGRIHRCRLVAAPLHAAADWLLFYHRFWDGSFDSLAAYLSKAPDCWSPPPPPPPSPSPSAASPLPPAPAPSPPGPTRACSSSGGDPPASPPPSLRSISAPAAPPASA